MSAFGLGVLLLLSNNAQATVWNVSVCVEVDLEMFVDEDYGDVWKVSNGRYRPFRGAKIGISRYNSSGVWQASVFQGFVSDSTGCTTVSLDSTQYYQMSVVGQASVNGVGIFVYEGPTITDPIPTYPKYGPGNQYHPTSGATITMRPPQEEWVSELAVAGLAMNFSNGGISELIFDSTDCCNGGDQVFTKAASMRKFLVAHEIGHAVARRRDDSETPNVDYDYSDSDNCDSSGTAEAEARFQMEWPSAAMKEGWADFYSVWVWNDDTAGNCEFADWQDDLDIDLNGVIDFAAATVNPISCEGIPMSGLESYVTARNWLLDVLSEGTELTCVGTTAGFGARWDATRYFWDMLTDESVPFGELVDIIDSCNPRTWAYTHDTVLFARNPFRRLEAAATANGVLSEHNSQSNNGVANGP
jgi:hypothetical protein